MAKQFPHLEPAHRAFIERQHVFFTATAAATGRINLSPKGLDSLRVLRDEKTIVAARAAAEEMVEADPSLSGWPLLAAEVDAWEQDSKSAYMERS